MTKKVNQTYFIKAPVAKVFNALTEPKMLAKWFLKSAVLDKKSGGNYKFVAQSHNDTQVGKVLDFKKNKKLVINWLKWAKGTKVNFTVKKSGSSTLLAIVHSGFKNNESLLGHVAGWTYYLTNLKSVLENNKDLRSKRDILLG